MEYIKKKGFTLIELLVVISIIGLLSTFALISLDNSRKKARDSKRKADLKQIQTALEVYYDKYGQYPLDKYCDSSIGISDAACPVNPAQSNWDYTNPVLIGLSLRNNGIMTNLPKDPINNTTYYYYYEPDCNQDPHCPPAQNLGCCWYELTVKLEGGGTFRCESNGSCR